MLDKFVTTFGRDAQNKFVLVDNSHPATQTSPMLAKYLQSNTVHDTYMKS